MSLKKNALFTLIIIFLFFLHGVIFSLGYDEFGLIIISFVIVPVIFAAWAFGRIGGGIISLLALPINLILISQLTRNFELSYTGLGIGFVFLILLGVFVGWTTDKDKEMRKELNERKKMEEKLAHAELWYRGIFDGVNDALLVETTKGEVLDVNFRACEIFGWTREEFLTKTIRDMVPPEHKVLLPDELDEEDIPEGSFETVNMRANGEYFPVSVSGRIQTIGDEKRLLIVLRDITEQKAIEIDNKKQHQFLSNIVESLTQPFYVVNVKDYSIAIANSTARGQNALEAATTCYALTYERKTPCDGEKTPCPLKEVVRTRSAISLEHVLVDENGEKRYFEFHGYPIFDARGNVSQMIEYSIDITERKKAMLALEKAKEKAEVATKAKADFLANMSHEIRTPLNAIYGMTSLMQNTPLNKEQEDFINTIRDGSDTLLSVINDILDFSKIEAGKMELEEQPFRLRNCIENTLDLLAQKANEKMLNLAYLIEDETPHIVVGDITRIRQILVNLLNNAIKFTEKGEVVISVESTLLENDQYEIHFSIRDTGIGIPKNKLNKLFQSFIQVDTSTTRKYGGTGLGLAISKELTEKMGGRIWVESEESKGSVFHFTIIAKAEKDEALISPDTQPNLAGKKILIVDDNATNRIIFSKQTKSWGMKPYIVESGETALALLEKENFDIVILDMKMPDMDGDGLTLAEEISQKKTKDSPPIIISTSTKHDKTRSTNAKIVAFLNKPIKRANLFNILNNILSPMPAPRKKTKKLSSIDPKMGEKHPLRILLAEDNIINQKVALKFLSHLGYQADLAANGIESIEALERQTYDVVFMDIQMPEMDGDIATQKIREKWQKDRPPYIIAMTAHALEGDREKYLARGMDDYISKPINIDALVKALEKASRLP